MGLTGTSREQAEQRLALAGGWVGEAIAVTVGAAERARARRSVGQGASVPKRHSGCTVPGVRKLTADPRRYDLQRPVQHHQVGAAAGGKTSDI